MYLDYTVGFSVGELSWLERDVAAGVLGLSGLIQRIILTINEVYDVTWSFKLIKIAVSFNGCSGIH